MTDIDLSILPEFDADILCADTRALPRPEWLEMRREGLGGSDAAAALGLSPYASPLALYLDKVDPHPDVDKPIYEAGRRAEPMIADWFADDTGWKVFYAPVMLRSRRHNFMLANPDRFVLETNGEWSVLELKNVDVSKSHEWESGPPLYARIQGLHYLDVCGEDYVRLHLAACIGGRRFVRYTVERDRELLEDLIAGEERFWTMVTLRRMPDVDSDPSTKEALKAHYAEPTGEVKQVGQKMLDLIAQRAARKESIKVMQAQLDEIENQMIVEMDGAEIGEFEGETVVTWKVSTVKEHLVKEFTKRTWYVPKKKGKRDE
jgi:putative phage-type endonuclease